MSALLPGHARPLSSRLCRRFLDKAVVEKLRCGWCGRREVPKLDEPVRHFLIGLVAEQPIPAETLERAEIIVIGIRGVLLTLACIFEQGLHRLLLVAGIVKPADRVEIDLGEVDEARLVSRGPVRVDRPHREREIVEISPDLAEIGVACSAARSEEGGLRIASSTAPPASAEKR